MYASSHPDRTFQIFIFAGDVEMRWVDTYFPFTEPSFELEIYFQVIIHDCLAIASFFKDAYKKNVHSSILHHAHLQLFLLHST